MKIPQRVKCLSCNQIMNVDEIRNGKCGCGKVILIEGKVLGIPNKDYIDISAVLLTESK
jgi:hypothetical protein